MAVFGAVAFVLGLRFTGAVAGLPAEIIAYQIRTSSNFEKAELHALISARRHESMIWPTSRSWSDAGLGYLLLPPTEGAEAENFHALSESLILSRVNAHAWLRYAMMHVRLGREVPREVMDVSLRVSRYQEDLALNRTLLMLSMPWYASEGGRDILLDQIRFAWSLHGDKPERLITGAAAAGLLDLVEEAIADSPGDLNRFDRLRRLHLAM